MAEEDTSHGVLPPPAIEEAPAVGGGELGFPADSVGAVAGPEAAPALPVVLPPQPFVYRRDGDWDCPKCANLNFARR